MLRLAMIVLLGLTIHEDAQAACPRITKLARPALASFMEFNKTHPGSIFVLLQESTPVGTGFLVDAESGLVLTAAHVLFEALNSSPKSVRDAMAGADAAEARVRLFEILDAWQSSRLDVRLKFDEVAIHPTKDIAVLRLHPDALKVAMQSQPFELGFSVTRLENGPTFGFPRIADVAAHLKRRDEIEPGDVESLNALAENYQPIWYAGKAEILGLTQYKVPQPAIKGDSGGPVILSDGTAFGVVYTNISETQMNAESIPASLENKKFLDQLIQLRRVDIIKKFRAIYEAGREKWLTGLSPSLGNILNLDIAHLVRELNTNEALTKDWAQFITCFIVEAAWQRYGPDVKFQYAEVQPSDAYITATARAQLVKELDGYASNELVASLGAEAAELLRDALSARTKLPQTAKSAGCKIDDAWSAPGTSADLFQKIGVNAVATDKMPRFCWAANSDDTTSLLAMELFELQRTRVRVAARAGFDLPQELTQFVANASAAPLIAVQLARDKQLKGRAFETLGDLFVENGKPKEAAGSFAEAYYVFDKQGSKADSERIIAKYGYVEFVGKKRMNNVPTIEDTEKNGLSVWQSIAREPLILNKGGS